VAFQDRLREVRKGAGRTPEQWADRAGIAVGRLRGPEQGQQSPSWASVLRLATALGDTFADWAEVRRKPRPRSSPAASGREVDVVSGRPPDLGHRRRVDDLWGQGLSLAEIGRRLGVTRQAIHDALRRMGHANAGSVACRGCGQPIASAGARRLDAGQALCLACLARTPAATLGQRLRAFRLAAGLRRGELARRARVHASDVKLYEEDRVHPMPGSLARLARALVVPTDVLSG
jgi:transcriptional regulator with XRE-family HTH domain